jgi:hypothetical protein
MDLRDGNLYWDMARAYGIEEKLPPGFALQGEIIGESIQGNQLGRKGRELYLFNVYNIGESRYLDPAESRGYCREMGWPMVPLVAECPLPGSVDEIIAMAGGKSLLSPLREREGIVLRPVVESREEMRGSVSRLSFKAISNQYLLSEK